LGSPKIRHRIAGIAAAAGVLELGDEALRMSPTAGGIIERGEPAEFAAYRGNARVSVSQYPLGEERPGLFRRIDLAGRR